MTPFLNHYYQYYRHNWQILDCPQHDQYIIIASNHNTAINLCHQDYKTTCWINNCLPRLKQSLNSRAGALHGDNSSGDYKRVFQSSIDHLPCDRPLLRWRQWLVGACNVESKRDRSSNSKRLHPNINTIENILIAVRNTETNTGEGWVGSRDGRCPWHRLAAHRLVLLTHCVIEVTEVRGCSYIT